MDVLRFDYSCTGDSLGRREDASWDEWLEDADYALDELHALAGLRTASVVGLRMGALVAAVLGDRRPGEVDRQVLWSPPRGGSDVVAWSRSGHPDEVAGFPVTEALEQELAGVDMGSLRPGRVPTLVLEAGPHTAEPPLIPEAEREVLPPDEPPCWVEDRDHGAGAVPVALLDRIVRWIVA